MRKGFEYWASKTIPLFLKVYWVTYSMVYLFALWQTFINNDPCIFMIIGFLPYLIVVIFRRIHKPAFDLENSILEIDPVFYKTLADKSVKIKGRRLLRSKSKQTNFFYTLLTSDTLNVDSRIAHFIKNNLRIMTSGDISLSIWFFTSFFLVIFLEKA